MVRPPNKIGEYAELGDVNRDKVKDDELEFAKVHFYHNFDHCHHRDHLQHCYQNHDHHTERFWRTEPPMQMAR